MEDDEYKILHSELDKAWGYGLRIVRINTDDNSISLKDIKEMDQQVLVNLLIPPQVDEKGRPEGGDLFRCAVYIVITIIIIIFVTLRTSFLTLKMRIQNDINLI